MRLRLGLIGQGADWITRYQPSLRLMVDRFEVKAAYSSVMTLAQQMARDFSATCEDSFRSLIQREDIDAVLILESDWYGLAPSRPPANSARQSIVDQGFRSSQSRRSSFADKSRSLASLS